MTQIWHPCHGMLTLLEESPNLAQVAAADGEPFWVKRAEIRRFTPAHRLPTRAPDAADPPWRACLRVCATIHCHVFEGHVNRAIALVARASGVVYQPDNTAFIKVGRVADQWTPSFRVHWFGDLPPGLPVPARREPNGNNGFRWIVVNNSFALGLLAAGFPFGWKK